MEILGSGLAARLQGDLSGTSVGAAGDVNGDGFADLIIGAYGADPHGLSGAGATYVVYGAASGFPADLQLSALDGSNGFQVNGEANGDHSGIFAASAGDINNDGYDDIIIGARFNDVHGWGLNDDENNGAAYVVFGSASGIPAELDLSALNGTNGFKLSGEAIGDRTGLSVSSAGDLNGDGFDDMLIGG